MEWLTYQASCSSVNADGRVDKQKEMNRFFNEKSDGCTKVEAYAMVGNVYYAAIRRLKEKTGKSGEWVDVPEVNQRVYLVSYRTSAWGLSFSVKELKKSAGCPVKILKCCTALTKEQKDEWEKWKTRQKRRRKFTNSKVGTWIQFITPIGYRSPNGEIERGKEIRLVKVFAGTTPLRKHRFAWKHPDTGINFTNAMIPDDFDFVE